MRRAPGLMAVLVVASMMTGLAATPTEESPRMRPLPLGGVWSIDAGDRHFGVYIPTQFGGVLTVETTSGKVGRVEGPDGRGRPNGEDIGLGRRAGTRSRSKGRRPPSPSPRLSCRSGGVRISHGTSTTGPPSPTRSTSPGRMETGASTRCRFSATTSWPPRPEVRYRRGRTSSGLARTGGSRRRSLPATS